MRSAELLRPLTMTWLNEDLPVSETNSCYPKFPYTIGNGLLTETGVRSYGRIM